VASDPQPPPRNANRTRNRRRRQGAPSTRPLEIRQPSKVRYIFMLLCGLLIGRIATQNFAATPLFYLDMAMYVGFAFCIAWAWRSWARKTMAQRHVQALRRAELAREMESKTPPIVGEAPSESATTPEDTPQPRRRRRRRRTRYRGPSADS